MTRRIARRSEQPPPPEPEGYGDVLQIVYGQTHLAVDIQPVPSGAGKDVSLACGGIVRMDKHTIPANRFRLYRAHVDQSVSCVSCQEVTRLGRLEVDSPDVVR